MAVFYDNDGKVGVSSPRDDQRKKVKTTHFGYKDKDGYGNTYIDHKNDNIKDAWIKRHQVNGCCMLSRPRLCSRSGALPATCAPSYTSLPPSLLPRG